MNLSFSPQSYPQAVEFMTSWGGGLALGFIIGACVVLVAVLSVWMTGRAHR